MTKEKSIRVSPKHGLNPTIPQCFFCGELKNEIALLGKLKGDVEAPKSICFDMEPCDKCKEYMGKGIILISVDPEKSPDPNNPYRTGGWIVVKDDYITRVFNPEVVKDVLDKRIAFMPDDAWDKLGLPRGEME